MESLVLFAQTTDSLSGGAGWMGAGLLGAVLAWLCFFHLPSKDKQVEALLRLQAEERDKDRFSRHELANSFQKDIAEMFDTHSSNLKEIQREHKEDAEKDRNSFMARSENIKSAIELQTMHLKEALRETCRFRSLDVIPNGIKQELSREKANS